MKKGANKRFVRNRISRKNLGVKKTLTYQLLIISSVILLFLIIVFILIAISEENYKKQKFYEGELGSIGIFGEGTIEEPLGVSYSLINDDQTMLLNIIRVGGNGSLDKIEVIFNRIIGNCWYNITSDLPEPNNSTLYNIYSTDTSCGNNFTGVFNVIATGIKILSNNINLTQTNIIPNLVLNENTYYPDILDLDDYFANLGLSDTSLTFSYASLNPKVEIRQGADFYNSHKLDFNISSNAAGVYTFSITLSYPGLNSVTSNNFNLSVLAVGCTDSDGGENYSIKGTATNSTANGIDSCYIDANVAKLREYYCNNTAVESYIISCGNNYYCNDGKCIRNNSMNRTPEFVYENCNIDDIRWAKNTNFSFNAASCFRDPDGDSMSYRFSNHDNTHVIISISGSNLRLVPEKDWFGSGDFYLYANDSINEKIATINFEVYNTITNTTNITPTILRIKDPIPSGNFVAAFVRGNLTFFVGNTDYDSIGWYLDNNLIETDTNVCEIKDLSAGNYTLEVQIKKGLQSDSKIWKISIVDVDKGRKFIFDSGKVMLVIILIVVGIVIFLIIWLFIEEKKKKNKGMGINFEVLDKGKTPPGLSKGDNSNRFNIPK